ncbi:hypothetical protein T492DRAFT_991170, partial [Pavlovales sp. CCMP2436]
MLMLALLVAALGVSTARRVGAPRTAVRVHGAGVHMMAAQTEQSGQQQRQFRWGDPARVRHDAPGVATPTGRGQTVDAKRLVNQEDVSAMWLSHILVSTPDMAELLLQRLREGADFAELAAGASACEATRGKGGAIGWVNREGRSEYADMILPAEAQALAFAHKPGDVLLAPSERGVHVLRVDDVTMRLRASTLARTRLRGAGSDLTPLVEAWDKRRREVPERPLTYEMITMGCQMNAADSERMSGSLEEIGFQRLDDTRVPPTDGSEQPALGCVAQQEGERLLRRVPEVDLVMGPQYSNRLGDLLEDALNGNQVVATEPTFIMEDVTKPRRGSAVCAWVNVIYGCNERCTYCVVPGTRGVEQSRPMESIRKEMEDLAAAGYKEITLLGQNIDAYGRDMAPKRKFADLLRFLTLAERPGIERVRFVTSHPRYMSENVITAVSESPRLMPVFHIPAQSGDDEVLNKMGRGYTAERYLEIVRKIRAIIPDAAITSDFIVATPGETDKQFEATLELMRTVRFDASMTAAYSPRPNTPMALWPDQLSEDVK